MGAGGSSERRQHGWEWEMIIILGVGTSEPLSQLGTSRFIFFLYVVFVYLCMCTSHLGSECAPLSSPPCFEAGSLTGPTDQHLEILLLPKYEAYRQAPPQLVFMWAPGIHSVCHACMAGTLPMEPLFQPRLYEKNFYCMNSACQLKTLPVKHFVLTRMSGSHRG